MYLGIDFGKKRIGLAFGSIIPVGIGIIDATKSKSEIAREIKEICLEREVEKIVIGLPTLTSGDEGNLAKEVKEFASMLESELGLEVILEPEGFTSVEAEEILREQGKYYDKKSGKLDELAAVLILEQYINSLKTK